MSTNRYIQTSLWRAAQASVALSFVFTTACGDDDGPGKGPDPIPEVVCETDTTAPAVLIGAMMPITGNQAAYATPQDQVNLLKKEINQDGCGVQGPDTGGAAIDFTVADSQDSPDTTRTLVDSMAAAGAKALIGGGTDRATLAGLQQNFTVSNHDLLYVENYAAGLNLRHCSDAELADAAITKVTEPPTTFSATTCWNNGSRTFRTRETAQELGEMCVRHGQALRPGTPISMFARVGGSAESTIDVADQVLTAEGVAHVINKFTNATPNQAEWYTIIDTITANDPGIIITSLSVAQLNGFAEAWAAYAVDGTKTKSSRFATLKVIVGTAFLGTDLTALSSAARTFLNGQCAGIQAYWDETAVGFQRWFTMYSEFYPDQTGVVSPYRPAFFDSAAIVALAMVKANSTDSGVYGLEVEGIVNPPGTVYYADQYKEARAAILRGEDIDYEGGLVHDFDEHGDAFGLPFVTWNVTASGTVTTGGVVSLADPLP